MRDTRPAAVIVLAAGGGTRMKSQIPKVLHRIGGQSLIGRALYAAHGLQPEHLVAVVGHGREQVTPHVESLGLPVVTAVQDEQLGTGHAAQCALSALTGPQGLAPQGLSGTVLVTYGDVPLLTTEALRDLLARHADEGNGVTVLTAVVPDPTGYGRVVRERAAADEPGSGGGGQVTAIVEHRDATDEQRAIAEINSGIYAFDAGVLTDALARIRTDNVQGELYLTDVVGIARADGLRVGAVRTEDVWVTEGVNDRVQLSRLGAELNRRTLERHMRAGVSVVDPATTWVDDSVVCEPDSTLLPGVQLHGDTRVATGATIGPDSTLTDVEVGAGATVIRCHGSGAVVGEGASVGPFAYLRPGTVLGTGGKIGTFVETKNAGIAEGAKVPHLSYVGDAEVGEASNIGAGTIFANYDGVQKHRTSVGAHCRTGSNNTFVAPVTIGDGAASGAGTVVRRDIPPGALAVSSGPQRNIDDWTLRKRAGTAAAKAAEAAKSTAGEATGERTDDEPTFRTGAPAGETEGESSANQDRHEENRQ
ncbi:MAG TPA: bifunctional UDP-N-acetylglucosamine diphosphorylase/glucosamine-1-phosphate N-acetyltransferase GlmU [Nocardioidaceae bacterium]|nr:bifunctional UDP-N-acetylglucosamine diphosphorylase/glucosamine-1-phosphate N-acetyltransferase GlmU [Nocardioidaceae bacterium]